MAQTINKVKEARAAYQAAYANLLLAEVRDKLRYHPQQTPKTLRACVEAIFDIRDSPVGEILNDLQRDGLDAAIATLAEESGLLRRNDDTNS